MDTCTFQLKRADMIQGALLMIVVSPIIRETWVFVIAALFALVPTVPAPAQEPESQLRRSPKRVELLQSRVQEKLASLKARASFSGVSVAFGLEDGRAGAAAAGFRDVEAKLPLRPTDRMLAGSIGKTFVAAVMLQLIEEKKAGLHDKLALWLGKESWFARLPNAHDLTLHNLMTHSSGLREYFEIQGVNAKLSADPDRVWKPEELIGFVLDTRPLFASGKGWAYADTNFLLVGMVIEKITGKPLFDEIRRRLLLPHKLERTMASDRRALPEVAVGYSMPRSPFGMEGRMIRDGLFVLNPQFEYAGGGLASTPQDLALWSKLLYEGKVFRNRETLEALLTGVDSSAGRGGGKGSKYGLGVQIRESPWGLSYGHGGWFPGYLSEMEYFPSKKVAIAVQFNTDASRTIKSGLRAYINEVARIILADDAR
jgi:D-alanyl-D-alanine carboxypeptidase